MLVIVLPPGLGADRSANNISHGGDIEVGAFKDGLLRWRRRRSAFGGEGVPAGLLVPLVHMQTREKN